jgi:hypothetical protein
MSDLFEAMEALAGRFSAVAGLTVAVGPIENIGTAPALIVEAGDGDFLDYQVAMGSGVADARLTITIFVQYGESKAARAELQPYLADSGTRSVYAIVAADPTLGGVVDSAAVLSARNLGRYTFGEQQRRYLGVEFPVEVFL